MYIVHRAAGLAGRWGALRAGFAELGILVIRGLQGIGRRGLKHLRDDIFSIHEVAGLEALVDQRLNLRFGDLNGHGSGSA